VIHQPVNSQALTLPKGKMTVYTFVFVANNEFLKIGQANINSKVRYQSHHYYLNSGRSTLANSLIHDHHMNSFVNSDNVTSWISSNC